jgi:hypothetical protein
MLLLNKLYIEYNNNEEHNSFSVDILPPILPEYFILLIILDTNNESYLETFQINLNYCQVS